MGEQQAVTDERTRELERRAFSLGDASAAETLYWNLMRVADYSQLMDRLIESAIKLETKKTTCSVWQKIAFIRGEPVVETSPEQIERLVASWSTIAESNQLHRVPREIRQAGFTTYCQQDHCVYRYGSDFQWKRIAQLSSAPPGRPFHVVETLADRDALAVRSGASCLVLANKGIYRSQIRGNEFSDSEHTHWQSIRFERGP
jgi:hypothetical protein